jgi:hypothetical protein
MRQRTRGNITAFLSGVILSIMLVMFFSEAAEATSSKPKAPQADAEATSKSYSDADAEADAKALAGASASIGDTAAAASSSNEGNELSVSQNYESGPADIVMVPNNNTEGCLRVFGFSFGNRDGGGGLGIPYRSARCDLEQAADDAFAAGERELGWFWKCHNKSLYKLFKGAGKRKKQRIDACHKKAVGEINNIRTIEQLQASLDFINNERRIERETYKESIERVNQSCEESKDKMMQACVNK